MLNRYDGNQAVVKGRNGNINNIIHVQAPHTKETVDPEAPGMYICQCLD